MEIVTLGINRQNSGTKRKENLIRINKKSDFPLAIKLLRSGQVVPFPECDFTMEAHIEGSSDIYKAERKGGVCKHCKQDGDRLIVFFDNHNFVEGRLSIELTIEHPDPDYSEDGIRQEHFAEVAPIQIVADNGDALDLRLPEPRVVEKIVEKEVDKYHYTALQNKSAGWAAILERQLLDTDDENNGIYRKIWYCIFKGYCNQVVSSNGTASPADFTSFPFTGLRGSYVYGAKETDPDFADRLTVAKYLLEDDEPSPYVQRDALSGMSAPNLDLDITISGRGADPDGLLHGSVLKTITILHKATPYIPADNIFQTDIDYPHVPFTLDDLLQPVIDECFCFYHTTADKLTIKIDTEKPIDFYNGGWFMLRGLLGSNIGTVDVGYTSNPKDLKHAVPIDFVVDKILTRRGKGLCKSKLIFRNVFGTVNEELKQKILAKGYPSVEFYEGENRVL